MNTYFQSPSPSNTREQRLARAECSLIGLSVGDALGGFFEFAGTHAVKRILARMLPQPPWHYTDDTMMALSIVETLRVCGEIDQDWLAQSFASHYERARGYGRAARAVLTRIQSGENWRVVASNLFGGTGSFGNGGAMRVAPLGGYFADDLPAVVAQARRSAEVTHTHPDAIDGAAAVALAAALAWRSRGCQAPSVAVFLDQIRGMLPPGQIAEGLGAARDLGPATTATEAAQQLGNGTQVAARDTVPFALWCAARYLDSYPEAIWQAASGLGDVDTLCAIVGGIVALRTGVESIPSDWLSAREPLPRWPFA